MWKGSYSKCSAQGPSGIARVHKHRPFAILHAAKATNLPAGVNIRQAKWQDMTWVALRIVQEKMNPLGLKPDQFLVAERGGELLGAAQLDPQTMDDGARFLELRSMVVSTNARGQGIGSTLVQQLLRQVGTTPVLVLTIHKRQSYYEQFGFTTIPDEDVPRAMAFERKVGSVVAKLVEDDYLVVLKYQPVPSD